jgi:putative ABC transport system permease protein
MFLSDLIRTALHSLVLHKGRSVLTILGVVIGIGAIIIIMSIGDSAQYLVLEQIQSFGAKNVFVNPGKGSEGLFSQENQTAAVLFTSLTIQDVERLRRATEVPDAVLVNPSVNASESVSYESETKTVNIVGSGAEVFSIYNLSMRNGEPFYKEDVDTKAAVIVLGKNIAEELFGAQDPIGQKIKIRNQKFKVVGVFSSDNAGMFGIDDLAAAPYTTIQQSLLGIRHFHEIAIQARDEAAVPRMVQDIKRTLRDSHNIDDPEKDDFIVTTQEDIIESVNGILDVITIFLAFVAAISLLVGGIGVMNIMFVSVTERTREIGLRKALGATNKTILFQFLLEAIVLTGVGGVVGIIGGLGITYLLTVVASYITELSFPFYFSLPGMVLGLVVACGSGLVFGIVPAYRASKKSPMEALRYE